LVLRNVRDPNQTALEDYLQVTPIPAECANGVVKLDLVGAHIKFDGKSGVVVRVNDGNRVVVLQDGGGYQTVDLNRTDYQRVTGPAGELQTSDLMQGHDRHCARLAQIDVDDFILFKETRSADEYELRLGQVVLRIDAEHDSPSSEPDRPSEHETLVRTPDARALGPRAKPNEEGFVAPNEKPSEKPNEKSSEKSVDSGEGADGKGTDGGPSDPSRFAFTVQLWECANPAAPPEKRVYKPVCETDGRAVHSVHHEALLLAVPGIKVAYGPFALKDGMLPADLTNGLKPTTPLGPGSTMTAEGDTQPPFGGVVSQRAFGSQPPLCAACAGRHRKHTCDRG
jgi:hypothetical protein